MAKRPARAQQLLEQVYLQLGANRIEERWIEDKTGVLGLASPGVIVINASHTILPVLLHECLHRIYPEQTNEAAIDRMATYLYTRLTPEECRRLAMTYTRRVKRIRKPTTVE